MKEGVTPKCNPQPQPQDPMPRRERQEEHQNPGTGTERRDRGGGRGAKNPKKPQKNYRGKVENGGELCCRIRTHR